MELKYGPKRFAVRDVIWRPELQLATADLIDMATGKPRAITLSGTAPSEVRQEVASYVARHWRDLA